MIFKKYLSILLTFFLLVSNLGLAFNVHYCDNRIASITLSTVSAPQHAEASCCGEVEKESKCCKNKIIKPEIKADQLIVKALSVNADFISLNQDWKPVVFTPKITFKKGDSLAYYCGAHRPPLYLLYSQYTFYA